MGHFDYLKDVSILFEQLSNKDQKYDQILRPISNQYTALSAVFLDYEEEHNKVSQKSLNNQQTALSNYSKQIDKEKNIIKLRKKDYANELLLFKKQIEEKISKDEKTLIAALEDNELLINNAQAKYQSSIHHNSLVKQREINVVDLNINEIKKNSAVRLAALDKEYKDKITEILHAKDTQIEELNIEIHRIKASLDQMLATIAQEKESYRKQSDDNYLSIKNVYYQASSSFNKKIDTLKGKRQIALSRYASEYRNNLTPIEKHIKQLEQNYQSIRQMTRQDLTNSLNNHHQKLEVIMQQYEKDKEALYFDASERTSTQNGKLASFKDKIQTEKNYENRKLNLRIKGLSIKEKNVFKKEFNRFVRLKDNELNAYITKTKGQTKEIQKQLYKDLLALDFDFINKKCQWRIGRAILELEYRQSLANIDFQYQYQLKEADTALKREKLQYDYQLALLEINYLSDIAPLESQLNIGNAIQEREINLLTNDTAYNLAYFTYQENLQVNQFKLLELEIENKREHTIALAEYLKSTADITVQLQSEKENVIRDAAIKKELLRKELFSLSDNLASTTAHHESLLRKSELDTNKTKLQSEHKLTTEYLVQLVKEKENFLQQQLNFADATLSYKENVLLSNRNIMQNSDELNVIHSRINLLYNQFFCLYNVNHISLIQGIKFYHLPSHPEDFKNLLKISVDLSNNLHQTQESILDDFLTDINKYHESKINQLTGYSFDSSLASLNEEFEAERNLIDQEKNAILGQIKHYENLMLVNHFKIDLQQNQINTAERRIQVDKNQATLRQLESQVRACKREIKNLEKDSAQLDSQINKANDTIALHDKKLAALFENHKEAINKLRGHQRRDAAIYFEQLALYQTLVDDGKKVLKQYYNQIKVHTDKLLAQIYLTDPIIDNFGKRIVLIESNFEKECLKIYQSLLNVGMRLYHSLDEQQHNAINSIEYHYSLLKTQFEKDSNDSAQRLNQIELKYQGSLKELEITSSSQLHQNNSNINKELLPIINNLRSEIAKVEDDIANLDGKTNVELELIETNLDSVLAEYQSDYDQKESSHTDNFKRQTAKLNAKISSDTTSINEHEISTQIKNDSLLEKFQSTYNKLLAQLNETKKKYDIAIGKENINKEKNLELLNKQIAISKKVLIQNQKNINKESVIDISQINAKEHRDAKKEFNEARKSHKFKTKALKL